MAGADPGGVVPCCFDGIDQMCFDTVAAASVIKTAQEVCELLVVAGEGFRVYAETLEVVFHKAVEGNSRAGGMVYLRLPNVAERG